MIKITDENREKIIHEYTEYLLDGMDFQSLWELAYEYIYKSKETMNNSSLENEINSWSPGFWPEWM